MNEQQRKIMDYVDSQQIDWSKPVEYLTSHDKWCPVIHSEPAGDGIVASIVRMPDGKAMAVQCGADRFRNVRRKVKHTAKYWTITDRHGVLEVTAWDKSANEWRKNSHFCVTEHTHEWEADADE